MMPGTSSVAFEEAPTDLRVDGDVVACDALVSVHVTDRFDDRLGQRFSRETAGSLAGHARFGDLSEDFVVDVGLVDLLGDRLEGDLAGFVVALDDSRRVNVLLDEVLGFAEQVAGQHRGGRRPVTDFLLLGVGDFDDHLGRGVLDIHLVENGRAVVCDDDVPAGIDEHLIHTAGPERRPYRLGHGLAGHDVGRLRVPALRSLTILAHNEHGLPTHASLLCHR